MHSSFVYHPLEQEIQITHLISLFHEKYPRNFSFKGETHDFWEFVYIDRGQLLITTGTDQYLLKAGEVIFHKPGEFHALQAYNHIASDVITSAFVCESPAMANFDRRIFRLSVREREYLYSAVRMKADIFHPDSPTAKTFASHQIARNNLELFLIHLINRSRQPGAPSFETRIESYAQQKKMQEMAKKINAYLEAHLSEKLSLEKIASDLNYSVSHMTKQYHRQTGQSIISTFNSMKMNEARRRIQEGSKTITQIANELGYDNIAYFSRLFSQHFGVSATETARSFKLATEDTIIPNMDHTEPIGNPTEK